MAFGGAFRRGAWRHWRGARSVPRLAVAAGVLAGVPGAMERRPLKFETLEERVRVLETKLRAMELNDLEEMRELALVAALGDFSGNSILLWVLDSSVREGPEPWTPNSKRINEANR